MATPKHGLCCPLDTSLAVCLGPLSIWKTHLYPNFVVDVLMLLQYFYLMFFPHDAGPSCSKTSPHHDATTMVLHSWDDVPRHAIFLLFPPNVTVVLKAKRFNFSFIRPQYMSGFLCGFWSNSFFLAEWPFSPCTGLVSL